MNEHLFIKQLITIIVQPDSCLFCKASTKHIFTISIKCSKLIYYISALCVQFIWKLFWNKYIDLLLFVGFGCWMNGLFESIGWQIALARYQETVNNNTYLRILFQFTGRHMRSYLLHFHHSIRYILPVSGFKDQPTNNLQSTN